MQITAVTQTPVPAAQAKPSPTKSPAAATAAKVTQAKAPVNAAPPKLTPANVPSNIVKQANSDGDGRTGVAALNDGDAAAQAARRQAFDVKA
jgi:hypothetical protein